MRKVIRQNRRVSFRDVEKYPQYEKFPRMAGPRVNGGTGRSVVGDRTLLDAVDPAGAEALG
ncbi:MAG: hypothetical protein ACREJM_08230, partial [Candidatus Saccharimonadales bacterium]